MKVMIPDNLDLEAAFPEVSRTTYLDQAAVFIDLVIDHTTRHKREKFDGWVHLKVDTIKNYIPQRSIAAVTTALHQADIVAKSNSYRAEHYPKSYRLDDRFNNGVKHWTITSKTVLKKLTKSRDFKAKLPLKIHKRLFDDLSRLSFQPDVAADVIAELHSSKRFAAMVNYKKICDKRFWATVDQFGNRFRSNLTGLKRELRKVVLADGERLVEIDISNSQPLILSSILGTDADDLALFRKWTEAGEFYDQFAERVNMPRDDVKEMMFKSVFYDRTRENASELRNLFDTTFPTVAEKLGEWKGDNQTLNDTLKKWSQVMRGEYPGDPDEINKQYKTVSKRLQRRESQLMIEGVAAKLKASQPAEFVGTVHDCILCKNHMVDEVKWTIREVFQEAGVTPTVSVSNPCNLPNA